MTTQDQPSVGIIVSRFQVDELHDGHRFLIDSVSALHDETGIALGVRRGMRNEENPLTYEERAVMVRQSYPDLPLTLFPIYDHAISAERWSKNLDELIRTHFPNHRVVLYGSRGSFIPKYSGTFPTVEIPSIPAKSGTEVRNSVLFPHTAKARAAIICAERERHGILYSTVDLAIIDWKRRKVRMIGKAEHDEFLSFPGGFIDPFLDSSGLAAVKREQGEEVLGIRISEPVQIAEMMVDDPRYRGTKDGIRTQLFVADYYGGEAEAGDDAEGVHELDFDDLTDPSKVVPWHLPLAEKVREHIKYMDDARAWAAGKP